MSKISQELLKIESSTLVNICRMSDGIIGLRLRVMVLILLFYPFFFLSLFCMLTLKIEEFSQVVFELESWNLVYVWMMSCGMGDRGSGSLLLFIGFKQYLFNIIYIVTYSTI